MVEEGLVMEDGGIEAGLGSRGARKSEGGVHGEPVCLELAVFGWWMVRESRTSLQRASCVQPVWTFTCK